MIDRELQERQMGRKIDKQTDKQLDNGELKKFTPDHKHYFLSPSQKKT